jgi:hypothetical protein
LDTKFYQYGSPVPLGSWVVQGGSNCGKSQYGGANCGKLQYGGANCGKSQYGGANCGDEGVGTSNPKSETFKQYMENLNAKYNLPQMGGSDVKPGNEVSDNLLPVPQEPGQQGQNAFVPMDVDYNNNPNYNPNANPNANPNYNPNANPKPYEYVEKVEENMEKKLNPNEIIKKSGGGFTTDPSEFIAGMPVYKAYDDCCPPAIIDGSLKFSSPDQPLCGLGAVKTGGSRKKRQHKGKSKRQHKGKSKRTQRGGDWTTSGRSKPAEYGTAFTGSPGVFEYPEDMNKRNFGCNQPSWGPECI